MPENERDSINIDAPAAKYTLVVKQVIPNINIGATTVICTVPGRNELRSFWFTVDSFPNTPITYERIQALQPGQKIQLENAVDSGIPVAVHGLR